MAAHELVERAVKLVRSNRFLTLATCADGAAWAAPINYVIGPGPFLHFYSVPGARHSLDIAATPRVAGAIFDSRAVGDEVDGMQFVATCSVVEGMGLAEVSEHYFDVNFSDPREREWWYRPPAEFEGDGAWRFYRLALSEIYLIDTELFEQTKIDRRVSVDLEAFLAALTS